MGPILLDPCADPLAIVNAKKAIMLPAMVEELKADPSDIEAVGIIVGDGLFESWFDMVEYLGCGNIFVNPPYGRSHNTAWAEKISIEFERLFVQHSKDVGIICLVPASVGAGWFKKYWLANAICFVEGRVQFTGVTADVEKTPGTFDSALVYFGKDAEKFEDIFKSIGKVVHL